jgi:hypothetical protein
MNKFEFIGNMKFDVIIGNPPYTIISGRRHRSVIWHKFIKCAFTLLEDHGYLCFVNPISWRLNSKQKESYLKDLKSKQIIYLKLAQTPFENENNNKTLVDWYIVENIPKYKATNIDFLDCNSDVDITFPLYNYNHSHPITKNILEKVLTGNGPKIFERQPFGGLIKFDKSYPKGNYKYVKALKKGKWIYDYTEYPHVHQFSQKVITSYMRQFRPFFDNGELGIGNNVHYLLINSEAEANFFIAIINSELGTFLHKLFALDIWDTKFKCTLKWNTILPFSKIQIDNKELKTDDDIYRYFDLTQEEIRYIKTQIQ